MFVKAGEDSTETVEVLHQFISRQHNGFSIPHSRDAQILLRRETETQMESVFLSQSSHCLDLMSPTTARKWKRARNDEGALCVTAALLIILLQANGK